MMDRLTVMGCLEGLTQDDWEQWYSDSEVQETAKAAISLLKEQEPMKPTWSQGKAYCRNCGQRLPRKCDGIERRFCSFCGQAVRWE